MREGEDASLTGKRSRRDRRDFATSEKRAGRRARFTRVYASPRNEEAAEMIDPRESRSALISGVNKSRPASSF